LIHINTPATIGKKIRCPDVKATGITKKQKIEHGLAHTGGETLSHRHIEKSKNGILKQIDYSGCRYCDWASLTLNAEQSFKVNN
jgi:hypothetical protein